MKNPQFSIIICSRNRSEYLDKCLESISGQKKTEFLYETVVIDDASTDNTREVCYRHKVQLISSEEKRGIGHSREIGFRESKGDIVVFLDDDCTVEHDWLSNLYGSFEDDVIGVGGKIEIIPKTLADDYLKNTGYGLPASINFSKSKNPIKRFVTYVHENIKSSISTTNDVIPVAEIYTANAAFLKSAVKSVGGFDTALLSSEDSDLCRRLNKMFPNKKIVYNPRAKVYHKDPITFPQLLIKNYNRSKHLLSVYKKESKTPPIFPFPLVVIAVYLILPFLNMSLLIPIIPPLIYFWWTVRFLTTFNVRNILFSYYQFSIELVRDLGLMTVMLKVDKRYS